MNKKYTCILGIETSCDETSISVYEEGKGVISNIVSSQVDIHARFGGVVPEIASRKHLEAIIPVFYTALDVANKRLDEIDAIACTQGPGLVGSLTVGWSFAKTLASVLGIDFVGVDHIYSHIMSVFLTNPNASIFPFVGLVVSGGHTSLFLVNDFTDYKEIGRTRDDAAGEAFDKVAKLLGLPYPGGPQISKLATNGTPIYDLPKPKVIDAPYDFSFSGLKTACLYLIKSKNSEKNFEADLAASFQEVVVDILVEKTIKAALDHKVNNIVVAGGVAANSRLREVMQNIAHKNGLKLYLPELKYCTDNAAMTAFAGLKLLNSGIKSLQKDDVYSKIKRP